MSKAKECQGWVDEKFREARDAGLDKVLVDILESQIESTRALLRNPENIDVVQRVNDNTMRCDLFLKELGWR